MRPIAFALALALCGAAAQADESFLKVGRDYMIRFSKDNDPFVVSKSGVSTTTITTKDGKTEAGQPAFWAMKATVQFFPVIEMGPRSWVRVEVPIEEDQIPKWNQKRQAMAQLTEKNIAELSATAEGKARLQELQDAATHEIKVMQVWVNLDHALAIADVPTDPKRPVPKVNISPAAEKGIK